MRGARPTLTATSARRLGAAATLASGPHSSSTADARRSDLEWSYTMPLITAMPDPERSSLATLPIFRSIGEMQQSQWIHYLRAVYGDEMAAGRLVFPLSLRRFTLFYADALPVQVGARFREVALQGVRRSDHNSNWWRHIRRGDLLSSIDDWFAPPRKASDEPSIRLLWVYQYPSAGCVRGSWPHTRADAHGVLLSPPAFVHSSGFANGTLVEVWHAAAPPGIARPHAQTGGVWMYLAIGSGVWHRLGRTRVFVDHQQAAAAFGLPVRELHNFRKLALAARLHGLDTLQFTHRCEFIYKFEILDVRGTSNSSDSPCPSYHGANLLYRSGWQGSTKRCNCGSSTSSQLSNARNRTGARTRCLNCRVQPVAEPLSTPLIPFCPYA